MTEAIRWLGWSSLLLQVYIFNGLCHFSPEKKKKKFVCSSQERSGDRQSYIFIAVLIKAGRLWRMIPAAAMHTGSFECQEMETFNHFFWCAVSLPAMLAPAPLWGSWNSSWRWMHFHQSRSPVVADSFIYKAGCFFVFLSHSCYLKILLPVFDQLYSTF